MSISVLLADDHKIMRDGLKALLDKAEEIKIIGEAADGAEALKKVIELRPDVVVMDLTMPVMSGIEATRRIVETSPDTKVLALSMLHDRVCVLECLKAGAKGYLVKNCAAEELLIAIRALAAGESYLCSKIAGLVIQGVSRNKSDGSENTSSHAELSKRELEVLKLIADGMSTKEIAYILNVSVKTINVQRFNIMKKLDLRSIAALIKYAVREGLTSAE
jgi:DNA-binding NarL/FixJ family response regulator